jgi:hypothetical protein
MKHVRWGSRSPRCRINVIIAVFGSGFNGLLGDISKIRKAHFRRLNLHILVETLRRSTSSTTAPAFFSSICKPIQQNCIFQALETHPSAKKTI